MLRLYLFSSWKQNPLFKVQVFKTICNEINHHIIGIKEKNKIFYLSIFTTIISPVAHNLFLE
jgi:hypothetical protein